MKSKHLSDIFKKKEEEEFYNQLKQLRIISPLNTYVHRSSSVIDQPKTSYFTQLIKSPRKNIFIQKVNKEESMINLTKPQYNENKKFRKSRNSLDFAPRLLNLDRKYVQNSKLFTTCNTITDDEGKRKGLFNLSFLKYQNSTIEMPVEAAPVNPVAIYKTKGLKGYKSRKVMRIVDRPSASSFKSYFSPTGIVKNR